MEILKAVYDWLKYSGKEFGSNSNTELCKTIIQEEVYELWDAISKENDDEIKDAFIDIIWVLGNLSYDKGISLEDLEKVAHAVNVSNFSKFCITEQEAKETVLAYATGTHPDKLDQIIDATYENRGSYYVVLRSSDKKILKSYNYTPVESLVR